jgi:hypothetical protein
MIKKIARGIITTILFLRGFEIQSIELMLKARGLLEAWDKWYYKNVTEIRKLQLKISP